MPEWLAYGATLVLVFLVNFFVLRHLVFRSTHGNPSRQFFAFLTGTVAFRFCEFLSFVFFVHVLGIFYPIMVVANGIVFTVLKYLAYGNWVFAGRNKLSQ